LIDPRGGLSERRLLDLLGLAARGRNVVSGTASVREGVREGKVFLVLSAGDVSETQLAKLLPLVRARSVPHFSVLTRAQLGGAIGRSPVGAVGITNSNLARGVRELAGAFASAQD
jgi:ribosomal protein L7Ae-like RNA K-turn-binding protein